MQIALDGSDLAAERFEGPSVYAGELLPRLSTVLARRGHRVITYAPGPLRGVQVAGEVCVIPGRPFWTQRILAAALRQNSPEVLFLPIQMLPIFRPRRMATVAVVHDLEFLRYPETYTAKNRLLLRVFTWAAVRQATRLIAVSQYTKDEVVRVYRRSPGDIAVVHHGVSAERAPARDAARQQRGVPERYLLSVGALQPRKNFPGLVAAYARLCERLPTVPDLVIAAGGGWRERDVLAAMAASSVRERVHLLRRVSGEELRALYAGAAAFVLVSFSEGFGLPVLEAMAAGVPVVTSNTSALPEVVGDAALLVDPKVPADIARGIERVLTDTALRDTLVRKGRARAAQFTWERSAEQTADVIESAVP